MSKRTREKKGAESQPPAKPAAISMGRKFAQPYAKTRLLFDHPHSYREWNLVGQSGVPLSLEPKRTLRPGSPNEFFWGIGIAKRPEIASQNRIVHCEMVASKHVKMLIC